MSPWLERAIELLLGGPESTFGEIALRVTLVCCSLFATVQLLTMLGTRWGDRRAMGKSFCLSVLLHFCFGLGWATVDISTAGSRSNSLADEAPAKEMRIPIRRVLPETSDQTLSAATEAESGSVSTSRDSVAAPPMLRERRRRASAAQSDAAPPDPERAPLEPMDLAHAPATTETPQVESPLRSEPREPRLLAAAPSHEAAPEASAPPASREAPRTSRSRQKSKRRPEADSSSELVPQRREAKSPEADFAEMLPAAPLSHQSSAARRLAPQDASALKREATNSSPDSPLRKQPDIPRNAPLRRVQGYLRGLITDAETGRPLPDASIRIDLAQDDPLTSTSRENGTYELPVTETPENFVVTITRDGYLPESRNLRSDEIRGTKRRLDLALERANESVIAIEDEPEVHHLGNDQFAGRINSQFQRKTEGAELQLKFHVAPRQLRDPARRAIISMTAKGVQCAPDVLLNGIPLGRDRVKSPSDGSFGPMSLPFDAKLLREGENEITFRAVQCNGDLDDFEFVNIQIRLTRREAAVRKSP